MLPLSGSRITPTEKDRNMPRHIHTFEADPKRFAGLTARRTARGEAVGIIVTAMNTVDGGNAGSGAFAEAESALDGTPTPNRPVEWWQAVELETVGKVAEARRKGLI